MVQYISFRLTRNWLFLHRLSPFEGSDSNCTIQRHHSSNSSLKLYSLLSLETPSTFSTPNSCLCGYPTLLKYMRERVSSRDVHKLIISLKGTFWNWKKGAGASVKRISRRCLFVPGHRPKTHHMYKPIHSNQLSIGSIIA